MLVNMLVRHSLKMLKFAFQYVCKSAYEPPTLNSLAEHLQNKLNSLNTEYLPCIGLLNILPMKMHSTFFCLIFYPLYLKRLTHSSSFKMLLHKALPSS